jgi:hypothetical protein
MSYPTINDPAFDREITLRDAYRIMECFVEAHVKRGVSDTVSFLSYMGIARDGMTGDPAAFDDYFQAVNSVVANPKEGPSTLSQSGPLKSSM